MRTALRAIAIGSLIANVWFATHYVMDGRLHCTVENPFTNHWKHNQL